MAKAKKAANMKFEVSVTAEIFFKIDAESKKAAHEEAERLFNELEKKGFSIPDGKDLADVMTCARKTGTFVVRTIPNKS